MKQEKKKKQDKTLSICALIGAIIIIFSLIYTPIVSWENLTTGNILMNFVGMIGEMIPPDFSSIQELGTPIVETLVMSVVATILAVIIAFPLSFLAAHNITPHSIIGTIVKAFFSALRSIPELIMGVIFVAAAGFGILPGILALGFHSIGMLGKFYAEAIEKTDAGLNEAISACGGSKFHVIIFSVIPQIFSHSIDYSLYRWEYNFRASTVVGLIGAGGVGFQIIAALRLIQYKKICAILIVVFALVQLVDFFGNVIRKHLIVA